MSEGDSIATTGHPRAGAFYCDCADGPGHYTGHMGKKKAWIALTKELPPGICGYILVTNNLKARDAFGKMSHVWLTMMVHKHPDGTFTAFAEPDGASRIENLTHWRPAVPEEW